MAAGFGERWQGECNAGGKPREWRGYSGKNWRLPPVNYCSMFNRIHSSPLSLSMQLPSVAPHKHNFSSDSDAFDNKTMQIFLKFPGGKITPMEFPEVPFLADVKRSLCRNGCLSSQNLMNSRFLLQGRALSNSRPLSNGDVVFIVPRLLGGVTPRGQMDTENQEPVPRPFPFFEEEPFAFGNR